MLTVAEALQLPPLKDTYVVAGRKGLGRPIAWVHNTGVPDAPYWLNGGELVLTTYRNMPDTRDDQERYLTEMADKGVAALAVAVGRDIERIPDHLKSIADAHDFPLLEISYKERFVDVARQVNEHLTSLNIDMVRRALSINKTLTQLVLEGGNFGQLAVKLAELVQHSISIETDRFEAIATENRGDIDEARRFTQLHGHTDPRLIDALEQRGYLPEIRRTLRPLRLPPLPDVGLEMERLLAPIVVHGEIYGYMWIIAADRALSSLDRMAIESGATIAALMMLYQESIQNAEASLKGSLLSQLIQGESARGSVLTDQSMRYGVDLRAPYAMMLVDCAEGSSQRLMQIYRSINQMVMTEGWHAVAGQFAGEVVVLTQVDGDLRDLGERLFERVRRLRRGVSCRVRVGVSAVQQGMDHVNLAHRQCQDVLHIARRLHRDERVVYFDELGYLHALFQAGKHSLRGNAYVPKLRELLRETQADLFNTLEAYLDAGGNGVATAEALHIHRSTLNYRLTRIEQVCGVKLSEANTRVNLQVALKLMRLFEVD